jgi:transcriptional regulator with XRE-family HTH domain
MPRLARSRTARIRLRAGFHTAREAAEALKCSRIYLLEIEAGRSKPGADLLERMREVYRLASLRGLERAMRADQRELLERRLDQLKRG